MRLWSWYCGLRGWAKVALGIPAAIFLVAALYVAGRTCQFVAAEKEAGLFIPSTANVVIRAKDLATHLQRIEETVAWRAIRRRLLKDPAIRPAINRELKGAGLPTLDDLEDERNRDLYSTDLVLRAAGRDAAAALRMGDARAPLRWVVVTRLRWSDYLLTPFAPIVLKSEEVGGHSALRLRIGKMDLLIAQEGRLALVANDRELLAQALRRTGTESLAERPLRARVEFGDAPALLEARRAVSEWGALPQIRMETVRAIDAWVDLSGAAALVDVSLEGAEPAREESTAPHALARLSPPHATGMFVSASGVQDLFDGLRSRVRSAGAGDVAAINVRMALEALDEAGFSSTFLPKFEPGMVLITGSVERERQSFPALAFILPTKNPQAAVEALCTVIKQRARGMADSFFGSTPSGETVIWSFEWPRSLQVNDFLRPCFAAIPGAFVFGNNMAFTEEILRGMGGEEPPDIVGPKKLREFGIVPEPALAGGMFLLPSIRESLDGPIPRIARYVVEESMGPAAAFRAKIVAEQRQQGRNPSDKEVDDLFYARIDAMVRDKQEDLRASLHALDFMKWLAFSLQPAPKGATLRAALEFR